MTSSRNPCLLALALVACTPPTPSPTNERASTIDDRSTAVVPQPPSNTAPAAKPPPSPTRAYVAVETAGVFLIDDAGWHLWHTAREPIRALQDIGGVLHVLSSAGITRVTGLGAVAPLAAIDPATYRAIGEPQAMALDGERAWVIGATGLARWTGSWTVTPIEDIAEQPSRALAIDAGRRPWAIWAGGPRRLDGSSWSPLELGPETSAIGPSLGLAAIGDDMLMLGGCSVDATHSHKRCRLLRFHDDTPTVHDLDTTGCPDDGHLAVSEHGNFAALVGDCGILHLDLTQPRLAPRRLPVDHDGIREVALDLAIDDGGRAWIGTGRGVTLVDPNGDVLQLPLARLTEIGAPVLAVHVTGSGPRPPLLGDEQRGGLSGRLVRPDRSPITHATIELCQGSPPFAATKHDPVTGETEHDPTRSACAGLELAGTTTSDDDGRFEVPNLVIGRHVIAVQSEGRWFVGRARSMSLRAGMTGNIGNVTVDGL